MCRRKDERTRGGRDWRGAVWTLALAVVLFGRAEHLRSIAAVRALSASEMDELRPVDLKGRVMARSYNDGILLEDACVP